MSVTDISGSLGPLFENHCLKAFFFSFQSFTSAVQGDELVATMICCALTLCDNPCDILSSSAVNMYCCFLGD